MTRRRMNGVLRLVLLLVVEWWVADAPKWHAASKEFTAATEVLLQCIPLEGDRVRVLRLFCEAKETCC